MLGSMATHLQIAVRTVLVSVLSGMITATLQAGTPDATTALIAAGTPVDCPVTVPNGSPPPGEDARPGDHGNGEIWTALWPDGAVLMRPEDTRADGSMGMKWPWWRAVPGQLTISGRRLDGNAPAAWAETPGGRRLDPATPKPGLRYGESPPGFQAVGLFFPTEGCWEITARAGDASLTFVTRVVRVEHWPGDPFASPTAAP